MLVQLEGCLQHQPACGDLWAVGDENLVRQGRQVKGLGPLESASGPCEGEQRFDEALRLFACRQHAFVRGAQRPHRRFRIAQRHLDQGALPGQWRPQLVRGVGHELTLGLGGLFQSPKQRVEGIPELFH